MTKTEIFNEVINTIYEDNFGHVDFMDNMGGDCDCNIHNVLNFLHKIRWILFLAGKITQT